MPDVPRVVGPGRRERISGESRPDRAQAFAELLPRAGELVVVARHRAILPGTHGSRVSLRATRGTTTRNRELSHASLFRTALDQAPRPQVQRAARLCGQ